MAGRISLPIRSDKGSLKMVHGDDADIQSIVHHLETLPGTHVLTRMLGVELKYNVTLDTAMDAIFDLRINMYKYEKDAIISAITAEFHNHTRLQVQLKWSNTGKTIATIEDSYNQ
jgi:hypothetical protein